MTTTTDLKAIVPTANAKNVVQAKGADVVALQNLVVLRAQELRVSLTQLIALHPTGGGDASNLTAFSNALAALV